MLGAFGPTGFRPDGPGRLYCEECGDWAHVNASSRSWCVHRWPGEPGDVESYVPDPSCSCQGYRRAC